MSSNGLFVSEDFKIPSHLRTEKFRFEVLDESHAAIDYEAVMSSRSRLRSIFFENDSWPKDDMSMQFNLDELVVHEQEFNARKAFAYAVLSPAKDSYIGCVYINPTKVDGYDCEVYLWVRDTEAHLDADLFKEVEEWLKAAWPFSHRAYPGRTIPWSDWVDNKNSLI
ncbi:hypothetical protein [Dasania marina]|uniref:hypothetical protein n=1 Tax=Dasania marina TaxID=471499 RepID=UPI0030D988A5|tara:strand:- start:75795 stop:76295 length:501 start_codon:yes stop_codon:yes gene_type:complete